MRSWQANGRPTGAPAGGRQLITGGRPIRQAAAETGFADQSHLTRWFTRYYGITPSAYHHARS